MKLRQLDLAVAGGLCVLGLFILVQAYLYGISGPTVTGPGFFPLLSGLLVFVSAGGVLFRQLRGEGVAEDSLPFRDVAPVAAIVVATAVFLLLVEQVGMLMLTPVYVFAVASAITPPRKLRDVAVHAAVAIGFTVFAWALFDQLLNVPLPRGLLASSD